MFFLLLGQQLLGLYLSWVFSDYFPDLPLLRPLFLRSDLYLPVDLEKSEKERNSVSKTANYFSSDPMSDLK